jgi:hypothetical protein
MVRCKTMALLAVYLFVTVSFIFFMSSTILFSPQNTQTAKVAVQNHQSTNTVERADKAIFKGNEKSAMVQLLVITLFFQKGIQQLFNNTAFYVTYTHFFKSHRYSYLSFLSLRI